jgi:hypothetical protein
MAGKEGTVVVLALRRLDKSGGVLRRITLKRSPGVATWGSVTTYGACSVIKEEGGGLPPRPAPVV